MFRPSFVQRLRLFYFRFRFSKASPVQYLNIVLFLLLATALYIKVHQNYALNSVPPLRESTPRPTDLNYFHDDISPFLSYSATASYSDYIFGNDPSGTECWKSKWREEIMQVRTEEERLNNFAVDDDARFHPSIRHRRKLAVISCDNNIKYLFLLPVVAVQWRDCGFELVILTTHPADVRAMFVDFDLEKLGVHIVHVPLEPSGAYTVWHPLLFIRLLFPLWDSLDEETYLIMSDGDMMPLKCSHYFTHDIEAYPLWIDDYSFYTDGNEAAVTRVLFCYSGGLVRTFREILALPTGPWGEIVGVMKSGFTHAEELYYTQRLFEWEGFPAKALLGKRLNIWCRSNHAANRPNCTIFRADQGDGMQLYIRPMTYAENPDISARLAEMRYFFTHVIDFHYKVDSFNFPVMVDLLAFYWPPTRLAWLCGFLKHHFVHVHEAQWVCGEESCLAYDIDHLVVEVVRPSLQHPFPAKHECPYGHRYLPCYIGD
eukprot:GCRY01000260.1.p1 GENE.GCRY01000260.1~~GCRY01000260.1.p1  ORF type:complete len:486 (+),score=112.23 GCRY01000260.1:1502-2959(+)